MQDTVNMSDKQNIKTDNNKSNKLAQRGRHNSEETNPCLKEQEASYKCIQDNYPNQEKCQSYFDNYKSCKVFWNSVQRKRARNNIEPHLPSLEEREKIVKDYPRKT